MEPGLFGLIQRMTGQPDIDQQIAQAMGRGPGQPGGPPASPLNPPPPGPAGAAAPAAGPAPAAGGAAAPAAPPTPQAYQTQPDVAQLYMQFMRQQQAAQMFNQGLAGLTASLSRSPDRNKYLSMGQTQPIDAGETFGNLVKLQQYQMGQQRFAATQAAVPGMLKGYGITDPAQIAFYQNNPDQLQTLIAAHAPEGTYKSWLLARDDAVQKSGADPNDPQAVARARAEFEQKVPLVNALTPMGADAPLNAFNLEHNDYLNKHNQQEPTDGRFNSLEDLAAYKARTQALGNFQTQVGQQLPSVLGGLGYMKNEATDISKSPDLDAVINKANSFGGATIIQEAREGNWGPWLAQKFNMTPAQLELLHRIDTLSAYNTKTLEINNPHLQGAFTTIDSSTAPLEHFEVGPADFRTNLTRLTDAVDATRAQAIGQSGQLTKALGDPDFEAKIDPSYLPKGRNYLGESQKMTPDVVAAFKVQAKKYEAQYPGRGVAIAKRKLALNGYDPDDPALGQ